jgi:hypothetical protein
MADHTRADITVLVVGVLDKYLPSRSLNSSTLDIGTVKSFEVQGGNSVGRAGGDVEYSGCKRNRLSVE